MSDPRSGGAGETMKLARIFLVSTMGIGVILMICLLFGTAYSPRLAKAWSDCYNSPNEETRTQFAQAKTSVNMQVLEMELFLALVLASAGFLFYRTGRKPNQRIVRF